VMDNLVQNGFQFYNWQGGEAAAGHYGISHAVAVPAGARTLFVGGQIGIKEDGTVPADLKEEIELAFHHVTLALQAAGLGEDCWSYVFSMRTFENPKDGNSITNEVLSVTKQLLKHSRPIWTGLAGGQFPLPGLHFLIEVQAYLPV
ncbi:unnamed protein product, partial [Clonostachys solani]